MFFDGGALCLIAAAACSLCGGPECVAVGRLLDGMSVVNRNKGE